MSQNRITKILETYDNAFKHGPGAWISLSLVPDENTTPLMNEIHKNNPFYLVVAKEYDGFMSDLHIFGADGLYYRLNPTQFLFNYNNNFIQLKKCYKQAYLIFHSYEQMLDKVSFDKLFFTFKAAYLFLQQPNTYVNRFNDIEKMTFNNTKIADEYKQLYMHGATIGLLSKIKPILPKDIVEVITTLSLSDYKHSYRNIGLVCRKAAIVAKKESQSLALVSLTDLRPKFFCNSKHFTKKIQGMERRKKQKENTHTISLPYTITGNGCRNR